MLMIFTKKEEDVFPYLPNSATIDRYEYLDNQFNLVWDELKFISTKLMGQSERAHMIFDVV